MILCSDLYEDRGGMIVLYLAPRNRLSDQLHADFLSALSIVLTSMNNFFFNRPPSLTEVGRLI